VGKSFVGKTQLINRIVNNNFCEYYEPTIDEQLYRLTYKTLDQSQFVNLIIEDLFPLDLPLIQMTPSPDCPDAELKQNKLKWVIKNNFKITQIEEFFKEDRSSVKDALKVITSDNGKESAREGQSSSQYSAIVFVYDVNSAESFA
jgi:GTPase SAR1 family protein